MQEVQQKMMDTTTRMLLEMLNQMWETVCNDPVVGELWSTMKSGNSPAHKVGIDPYQVIGLDKSSTDEQIKKRHRELAFKLHPDTAGIKGTEFLFKLVMAAYKQIAQQRGWQ